MGHKLKVVNVYLSGGKVPVGLEHHFGLLKQSLLAIYPTGKCLQFADIDVRAILSHIVTLLDLIILQISDLNSVSDIHTGSAGS